MSHDGLLQPRPLESALFGVSVVSGFAETPDDVHSMCQRADGDDASLLVIRVPAQSVSAAQAVEAEGGKLCDVLLTMSTEVAGAAVGPTEILAGLRLRSGSADDGAKLRHLARATFRGFVGHWHADVRLPPALADELYANWAGDLANTVGGGSPLVVAERVADECLVGFLSLRGLAERHWDVPLTGVAPEMRGHGVLRSMLAFAMNSHADALPVRFDYETQLANIAALRAVSACGFVPTTSRLTFHRWKETDAGC